VASAQIPDQAGVAESGARDEAVAARLWEASEELSGVHYELGTSAVA
jgi:hypothetical protein